MNDVVAVRGGRGEVIKMRVKILREIGAGNADVGEVWNGAAVRGGDDVVDRLGGGCRPKRAFAARDASLAFEISLEGFEEPLPRGPRLVRLGLPSQVGRSFGNELACNKDDVAKAASHASEMGRSARVALRWASSIRMMNWGTRGSVDQ